MQYTETVTWPGRKAPCEKVVFFGRALGVKTIVYAETYSISVAPVPLKLALTALTG